MQRTTTVHVGQGSQASPVSGLRLFGQQRLFSFDAIHGEHRRQHALTIGRDGLPVRRVRKLLARVAMGAAKP